MRDINGCPSCGGEVEDGACKSHAAFMQAVKDGRLSETPDAPNYAGNYMFMGHHEGRDLFKNIDTRRYDV